MKITLYFLFAFNITSFAICHEVDTILLGGGINDHIKMVNHPGDPNLNELSICLRLIKNKINF